MADLKERLRANALDECDKAIERIEALEAALTDIARQKKTDELETEYDVEVADFETGYDTIIDVARKALNPSS